MYSQKDLKEKEKQIINGVFDCILKALNDFKEDKPFDVQSLSLMLESIRIMGHVRKMNDYIFDHSDKSVGTSESFPSSPSQS